MADFHKMKAWQKADDFVLLIYEATRAFPDAEKFGLTSQMRRAAVSVPANIAEGAGREHVKDFLRFLYIARGSLSEVEYYLHLARRLQYLDDASLAQAEAARREAGATLQGFVRSLEQQSSRGRTKN